MSDVTEPAGESLDTARFRQVLGHFPTGVAIVTAMHEREPAGLAVGSFFSVSLDPPLVVFGAAQTSTSWPRVLASGSFCANILAEDQEALCRVFASSGADKFRGQGWKPAPSGSPILFDVVAWIDCEIEVVHEAGDHVVVLGRVNDLEVVRDADPLVFFRGGYSSLR